MGVPVGNYAGPQVGCRANLQRDLVGNQVLDQLKIFHRLHAIPHPFDIQRPQRSPDALRTCRLTRMSREPEPGLGGAVVDPGVLLRRMPHLRPADADPDDAGLGRDLLHRSKGPGRPCRTCLADQIDDQGHLVPSTRSRPLRIAKAS